MPWNTATFTFSLEYDFTTDSGSGSPNNVISSEKFDNQFDDIATGMAQALNFSSAFRNQCLNGDFQVWSNGAGPFTTDGVETADRWHMTEGTGATVSVDRTAFTAGQTDVPDNPKYYIQLSRTVTGSTKSGITHRAPSVRLFSGETVTMSFWAKVSAGTPEIDLTVVQDFGTGGSPDPDVTTAEQALGVDTTWTKYTVQFTLASISGKTLGSNNDDYTEFRFDLATDVGNIDLDISHVQIEKGTVASPFEFRDETIEAALITTASGGTYLGLSDTQSSFTADRLQIANSAGTALESFGYEVPTTVVGAGYLWRSDGTDMVATAYTFPAADGTNGQVLGTNGAGALSFVAQSGGGGEDQYARDQIAHLWFTTMTNGNLAKTNIIDGFVDVFEDTTGINTGSSSGYIHDDAEETIETDTTSTIYDTSISGSSGTDGWANYSVRVSIPTASITANATTIQIKLAAHGTEGVTFDNVSIVERNGSTDDGTTTPTEFLFSASSGVTIAAGATATSDNLTYSIDSTKDYLVCFDVGSSSSSDRQHKNSFTGATTYWAASSNSYNTQNFSSTGNAADENSWIDELISVGSASSTVISQSVTADAAPDTVDIVLEHEPVDSVTLNTDTKISVSRDGGTTYTQATLAREIDGTTDILIANDLDISAQPSGTTMLYKYETANSKAQKLHAVSIQWGT